MASKGLTEAWRGAEAAKPSDWSIRSMGRGPREVDPAIHGDRWVAWARGPNGERAEGSGEPPHDALLALTLELRRVGE